VNCYRGNKHLPSSTDAPTGHRGGDRGPELLSGGKKPNKKEYLKYIVILNPGKKGARDGRGKWGKSIPATAINFCSGAQLLRSRPLAS
jgi:hypothetical protein